MAKKKRKPIRDRLKDLEKAETVISEITNQKAVQKLPENGTEYKKRIVKLTKEGRVKYTTMMKPGFIKKLGVIALNTGRTKADILEDILKDSVLLNDVVT